MRWPLVLPLPVIVGICGQEATPEFSPGFATHYSVLDTGHVPSLGLLSSWPARNGVWPEHLEK